MARILIVEDNEMNRDMLQRRLQRRGHDVLVAVDAEAGIAMARETSPDLVVMDLGLPGIDGWEATRRLRVLPETRRIPVIALSSHVMAADRARALEAGCNDYDTKPVDLPRLLGKMESLLATGQAPRAPTDAQGEARIERDARVEYLPELRAFVERCCEAAGLDEDGRFALVLAADEACTNVAEHGYKGRPPGPIALRFRREGDRVALTITDHGRSFPPDAARAPDLDAGWERRTTGGLGWYFIRTLVDEIDYRSDPAEGNRLTLVKRLTPSAPAPERT